MIGKNLGNFEITSKLGKGGMGEVYQAKDLKLGRNVAIKVLPEEFAEDADRIARFQREAKLLASLNHPSIAAIYGLEESNGTHFLVLELIEGDTLADQIDRGPIPVEDSLKLALQIAEALEAAHEKGVIHRDLKPANIKVTPDGKVKVLDFGLAKAFAGEQAEMNLTASPTLSHLATQQGIILGTAAYMSPEQAKGKTVDKRADIWAFGCVLFEMLTGQAAFQGEDVSTILAAVIRAEPDWSALPAKLHWRSRELLERCLDKDARNRYSGISDARVDIQKASADPRSVLTQPLTAEEHRSKQRTLLPWIAAAVVLTAIIASVAVWNLKPPEPRHVIRFTHELPKEQQFGSLFENVLAVSPDGRQFVYSTDAGLWLRSMEDLDGNLLPGTAGTQQRPFFSPDGKWIGFFSSKDGKLKKVAITGGAPVTLADVNVSGSFNWNADDTIIYGQVGRGVMRVSANGGTLEPIIKAARNDEVMLYPQILPDGKSTLFTLFQNSKVKAVIQSLQSGQRKELLEGGMARYLPTGHIVYAFGDSLFAIRFDVKALKVVGGPVSVIDGIFVTGGARQYAVSDSGTLAFMQGLARNAAYQRTLVWVDRIGKEEAVGAPTMDYRDPRISPDGKKVVLGTEIAGNRDVHIWDLVRKTLTRLTFDPALDGFPIWTPDGKRVVFRSDREGGGIYSKAADGTGNEEKLYSYNQTQYPSSWSADGKILVFMKRWAGSNIGFEILTRSMEGNHEERSPLHEKGSAGQARVSPDGRWLAYTFNDSGKNDVYVRPFPDVEGGRWQVSSSGGDSPIWSRDGRELFYRKGDAVMEVAVKPGTGFNFEPPKMLFRRTYVSYSGSTVRAELSPWDISLDGRFLMMKESGSAGTSGEGLRRINIVLNWFEELKQRVPVK